MAKRKRSTALFEVISKSRQYRPARPATARSGNWFSHAATWFVRPKFQAITTAGASPHPIAAQEMEYDDETPIAVLEEPPEFAPPVEMVKYQPPARPIVNQDIATPAPSEEANVHVTMDSDRRQIRLNMSYTAAAVAGMGLIAVICLSVIIGQRFGRSSLPLLAQSTTEDLRRGPAHREVLDPPRRSSVASGHTAAVEPKVTQHVAVPAAAEVRANTPLPESKRYINLNYVVVQSYPAEEQAMADKAATYLNNHGVNCTVEQNVKGFLPVSVVGLEGFPKISSTEFKTYVDHIKKLSTDFTSNSRSFKAFDPRAKKWDKQD
jgi:hypothetical protein